MDWVGDCRSCCRSFTCRVAPRGRTQVMSKFWDSINPEDPFANTENFGPVLPNGRNAYGMTKDEIYFAIHGKTQKQIKKEMGNE